MDGASDQFLTGTCLAANKHGGICRRHCRHKFQDAVQRLALADNLLKISFSMNLVLKVKLFLSEFVRKLRYLAVGQGVFHCNRHLTRNLHEKVDINPEEGSFLKPGKLQNAQRPIMADQG